jgi:hypothetical protein
MIQLAVYIDWGSDVSELQPPSLLFILQVIYEYREPRWNDIDREIPKNSEKNLPQCRFVYHRSHMD